LNALADWLQERGIETVAMQSTGVYWIPLYDILEERKMRPFLVNAQDTKNMPGRKSDIQECQWLMKLHAYGLLKNSFRPEMNLQLANVISDISGATGQAIVDAILAGERDPQVLAKLRDPRIKAYVSYCTLSGVCHVESWRLGLPASLALENSVLVQRFV